MKNNEQKDPYIIGKSYTISINHLKAVYDKNSNSGKSGKLFKGKACKYYPKKGTNNSSHLGKSEYYFKPAYNRTDLLGVIISRELKHVFKHNTNIEACKQILKEIETSNSLGEEYVIGSKAVSIYTPFNSPYELRKEAKINNDFLKILGAEIIHGNPDWNSANYGTNNAGKIIKIDIDGPYFEKKPFRGSFISIDTLIYLIIKNSNEISEDDNRKLIKTLEIAYKKHIHQENCEEFNMNAKSIEEFLTRINNIAFSEKPQNTELAKSEIDFLKNNTNKDISLLVSKISKIINEKVSTANENSKLFQQLCAYIDGATEFYHRAPNAEIEEKHILGLNPSAYRLELKNLQHKSFEDFQELIRSFNNQELTSYFDKKNEMEVISEPGNLKEHNQVILPSLTKNPKFGKFVVSELSSNKTLKCLTLPAKLNNKDIKGNNKPLKIRQSGLDNNEDILSYIKELPAIKLVSKWYEENINTRPDSIVSNPVLSSFYGTFQEIKNAFLSCCGGRSQ